MVKSQEKSEQKVKREGERCLDKAEAQRMKDEDGRIRWLRLQVDLTRAILYQDPELDLDSARTMVLELREKVLKEFPGKDDTFDLILLPRFERILRERWSGGLVDDGPVQ